MARIEIEDGRDVVHLYLNRPKKLNALDPALLEVLIETTNELKDHQAKLIVLAGRGRAFSAGADLMSFSKGFMNADALYVADLGRRAAKSIADLPQLTLARIDGPCIGGGLVLALACDLRWATSDSTFSMPELPKGIPVGWGGIQRLCDTIGVPSAKQLVYGGGTITATQATQLGLIGQNFKQLDHIDHAIKELLNVPRFTLEQTNRQFQSIHQSTFVAKDDAQIMLDAAQNPQVIKHLLSRLKV